MYSQTRCWWLDLFRSRCQKVSLWTDLNELRLSRQGRLLLCCSDHCQHPESPQNCCLSTSRSILVEQQKRYSSVYASTKSILFQSDEIVLHFSDDLFLFVQIFEKQMLSIWDVNTWWTMWKIVVLLGPFKFNRNKIQKHVWITFYSKTTGLWLHFLQWLDSLTSNK